MVGAADKRNFSGFKHHAKVHRFRIGTAILRWVLLGATLFYRPEWIRWALRTGTHASRVLAMLCRAIGVHRPRSS